MHFKLIGILFGNLVLSIALNIDFCYRVATFTGTLTNSPAQVIGINGQALSFNGTNSYVDMGNDNVLNGTQNFTISFWYYLNPGASLTTPQPIQKWGTTPYNYLITSLGSGPYMATMYGGSSGGSFYNATSYTWETGKWVHLVWTFQAGSPATNHLYINTVDQALTSQGDYGTFGIEASTDPLQVGNGMNGKMDDIRIYNRALSQTEVNQIYRQFKSNRAGSVFGSLFNIIGSMF